VTDGAVESDDGLALAAAIRRGETTAAAALEAAFARAQAMHSFGAISCLASDLGRDRAAAIDLGLKDRHESRLMQPFTGVPFLMKDLGAAMQGLPLTCGSRALPAVPAAEDSELARRFKQAGLVPFGTTTVPEFGLSLASEPVLGPIARNPLDPSRTPGGSSGGAAVAVAAGITALAHATDAGGSTRVPAACCGLVGLKPTRGAVPGGPTFGNHLGGIAAELVVSRTLRDTAAALDAVAGFAPGPFPDPDLAGPLLARLDESLESRRVGVCLDVIDGTPIADARRAAVEHAADVLATAGHRVIPISPDALARLVRDSSLVFDRIICVNLARGVADASRGEPLTAAVARRGLSLTARDLQAAELLGVDVAHRLWLLFQEVDVILLPMLSGAPPPIGSFPMDHDDVELQWRRMTDFAPYATLANVAGTPALTIPHGIDGDALPLPVQLIGPMGADGLLLRLARLLQQAVPWSIQASLAGLPG
jgi:amidase